MGNGNVAVNSLLYALYLSMAPGSRAMRWKSYGCRLVMKPSD